MAICDIYTANCTSGGVTVNSSSATPILNLQPASTKRDWVLGLRISIGVTTAAAGNTVLFSLMRPGNSGSVTGTSNIAPNPNDSAAAAALSSAYSTWSTAPTTGLIVWQMELPFTTGTSWEDFPPPGCEWVVPTTASNGIAVFVTCSVANSTPFFASLVFGE